MANDCPGALRAFALRLSPFVLRLSPFAFRLSPFALCPSAKRDGEAGDAPRNAERCDASRRAFRPLPFALRPSPFALRPSPFALCPLPFALCPSPFALRLLPLKVTTPGRQNQAFGPNDAVRPAISFYSSLYRIGSQLHIGGAPQRCLVAILDGKGRCVCCEFVKSGIQNTEYRIQFFYGQGERGQN